MPACTSCKLDVAPGASRCARCGAAVSALPFDKENPMPGFELALDSKPPPPKRPPPPNRPAPTPGGVQVVQAGAAPRPPPAMAAGPSLDLDIGSAAGVALPPKLAQAQGASQSGLRLGADGKLVLAKPPSRQSSAGLDSDGLDPYEVRAFADFGEPPTAFWLTPFYAYRVHQRRAELRAELERREEAARAADEKIEDAIVAFGERVRPIAAQNPIYKRAVAPVEDVERLVMSRDSALKGDLEAYRAVTGKLDERLRDLEAKLHRLGEESAGLEGELARLEEAKARAEAKAKRAEIEMRSAEESAAALDDPSRKGALTVHLQEKRIEQASHAADVERLTPLIEAQKQKLEAPRAARADVEREIAGVRKERAVAEQALKRKTDTREAGSSDARKRLRDAYGEFGRLAITDAKTFGGEYEASRRAIELLVRDKADREQSALLVRRAIAVADDEVVKRGVLVGIAGVVVLLLVVIGLPLLRVMRPVKPPPLYPTEE